jgi:HD superfamily phosphohydrolase
MAENKKSVTTSKLYDKLSEVNDRLKAEESLSLEIKKVEERLLEQKDKLSQVEAKQKEQDVLIALNKPQESFENYDGLLKLKLAVDKEELLQKIEEIRKAQEEWKVHVNKLTEEYRRLQLSLEAIIAPPPPPTPPRPSRAAGASRTTKKIASPKHRSIENGI